MRTRLVVLPDLDQELTAAFGEVEELLLTLQWQETEDPDSSVAHHGRLPGSTCSGLWRSSSGS